MKPLQYILTQGELKSVWTIPSGTWCNYWSVLCRARGWTQSWWVLSNSAYSVIKQRFGEQALGLCSGTSSRKEIGWLADSIRYGRPPPKEIEVCFCLSLRPDPSMGFPAWVNTVKNLLLFHKNLIGKIKKKSPKTTQTAKGMDQTDLAKRTPHVYLMK